VEYFVSYYDYYQPEAYIPQRDVYIEKDASINDALDRLRLAATSALLSRRDVVIVASVSCIYGLGSPEDYTELLLSLAVGETIERDRLLGRLVEMQYQNGNYDFKRGTFRARGDVVEVYPSYEEDEALRIEMFGDQIESLCEVNPLTGEVISDLESLLVFPAKHFVLPEDRIGAACEGIEKELGERLAELRGTGKLLEAQRLEARTLYDLEMLREVGYCKGIENYARHLTGRAPGQRPFCLLDYFPRPFLTIVDESHATIPQIGGMYAGDRSRKMTLVEHGFRLPSALDNRPLCFPEWEEVTEATLFVSATPADHELAKCSGEVVEQIIRPTGLVDPEIHVRSAAGQVGDLIAEIKKRAAVSERVLVTTLTKRLAEDLSTYLERAGIRSAYLHSEMDALERVDCLRRLRQGDIECVVGINLLREGLDLPEVSLVAILDADKEGFLRSETSLIQTIGRAARNVNATVLLYADTVTGSMARAIDETNRRRSVQLAHNALHGIEPETIKKAIREGIDRRLRARKIELEPVTREREGIPPDRLLELLERDMREAAEELDFERAAVLRDRLAELKGEAPAGGSPGRRGPRRRPRRR
ncbi:MAG: excinuclease ABC subunit UvrB, partial [Planctomycetes bacterium]|nr:excinuclease ABC subunit UvrB [Planctomycetota bacterium]